MAPQQGNHRSDFELHVHGIVQRILCVCGLGGRVTELSSFSLLCSILWCEVPHSTDTAGLGLRESIYREHFSHVTLVP